MTFLNPLALFGLLAAGIPILLHLFNLRKLRTIEFSTLAFLKELQKSRIRRLRVRQILLLVLRTLLVIMIALAFSRPTLKGSVTGSIGTHARTSAVFIIDDSYSMTTSDDHGELLKQVRLLANNTLSLFTDGDEIFLLPLSSLDREIPVDDNGIRDFAVLKARIDDVKPSAIRRSLESGLRVAARLLATSKNFNKEVYLFSDLQQGVASADDEQSTGQEQLFPEETRFFLVPVRDRNLVNLGLVSLTIPTTIFERGKPFIVQTLVGNFTENDVQDHVVSLYLHGVRIAERSIDIPGNTTAPVEFSISADTVGSVEGFVELEHDDAEYDNRRYFAIRIPEKIRVLLVGLPAEIRFPRLALSAKGSTIDSAIEIDEITPGRMSSSDVRRADVLVLCTTEGFSGTQISELGTFVKSGRGLMLFPGLRLDPASFNAQLGPGLGAPGLAGIDRPAPQSSGSGSFLEFDKADLKHPLFEGVFESEREGATGQTQSGQTTSAANLESPRIRSSAHFTLPAQSNSIISLTNGAPFLLEQHVDAGRLLVVAVPTTGEWSDFPSRGLFVPLLHGAVRYLAGQHSLSPDVLPGSEVILRAREGATGPWNIRTPLQVDVALSPSQQLFQQIFRFAGTDEPGVYTLRAKQRALQNFVVNLDPRESQTTRAPQDLLDNLLAKIGVSRGSVEEASTSEDIRTIVLQSRFGTELWKYFVFVALLIALVELLVARISKKETILVSQND